MFAPFRNLSSVTNRFISNVYVSNVVIKNSLNQRQRLNVRKLHLSVSRNGLRSKWRAPTLMVLKKQTDYLKEKNEYPQDIRSQYIEWNYDAELYAFGKRLNEEFDDKLLREAFTDPSYLIKEKERLLKLGIEQPELDLNTNKELAESGKALIYDFCIKYIRHSSPLLPEEGIESLADYLVSEAVLSKIAKELGFRDLILTEEYPPNDKTYAMSFAAVVSCVNLSSGLKRCQRFILDFVATQLIGKDLWDIWEIDDPQRVLSSLLSVSGKGKPEPRIMGSLGPNTIESVFQVGIYDGNKELIGTGYGESIEIGVEMAYFDALSKIFGQTVARTPLVFEAQDISTLLKDTPNFRIVDY